MPRIKSAIKRVDVAERNREKNRAWKSTIRSARTKVQDAVKDQDSNGEEAAIKNAFSIIDRAVSKGVLHKNTAARRKSRLVALARKAKQS